MLTQFFRSDTCPACGEELFDHATRMGVHSECKSWSCRRLLDVHSIFYPRCIVCGSDKVDWTDEERYRCTRPYCQYFRRALPAGVVVEYFCRLCLWPAPSRGDSRDVLALLQEHIQAHDLRGCNQEIFSDNAKQFGEHLLHEHKAGLATECVATQGCRLDPWALTVQNGQAVIERSESTSLDPLLRDLFRSKI